VFIDPRYTFYGADLVQNDPFLRGPVVRMLSHGDAWNAAMMRHYFPEYHRTVADLHGEVWTRCVDNSAACATTGMEHERNSQH
jgi:hypothetical protein